MWVTSSCTAAVTPTAVALGNFDGLHLGHRQVVQPILNRSVLQNSGASSVPELDWQSPCGDGEIWFPRGRPKATTIRQNRLRSRC
ncbi:MAG: hypothetical protein HC894_32010 [Microcoleus sp. SM1_3_4]|nr:hypothetical protein [Microcoleus sp. SM1_3_4]